MKSRFLAKWPIVFLIIIVLAISATLNIIGQNAFASSTSNDPAYNAQTGQAIVSMAEQIALGESPWSGGCVPNTGGLHCVPYSWGAGHKAQPGPSYGNCSSYTGHKPCIAPITFGLDCSGFTRWVYRLIYGKDVLGQGNAQSQIKKKNVKKVAQGSQQPGDLVFFIHKSKTGKLSYHIGIVAGNGLMINAPHSYDKPGSAFNSSTTEWVQAYVRVQSIPTKEVSGYYRYDKSDSPSTPTLTPTFIPTSTPPVTPTVSPLPQFSAGYSGSASSTVPFPITTALRFNIIQEDQQGNFSGVDPTDGNSLTGKVSGNMINFTLLPLAGPNTVPGETDVYTGTVVVQNSIIISVSGTFVDSAPGIETITGTWQVSAIS